MRQRLAATERTWRRQRCGTCLSRMQTTSAGAPRHFRCVISGLENVSGRTHGGAEEINTRSRMCATTIILLARRWSLWAGQKSVLSRAVSFDLYSTRSAANRTPWKQKEAVETERLTLGPLFFLLAGRDGCCRMGERQGAAKGKNV